MAGDTGALVTVANASDMSGGAATIADGADVALGAKADSAASSDTGTFSLIALIKRALQSLTTLIGRFVAAATLADATALPSTTIVGAANLLLNGTTLDVQRGNTEGTALSSSARSATNNSADLTNYNAKGVVIYFNVSVVPGTDTVTLSVEGKDPVTGNYGVLFTATAIATTIQPARYVLYPGASGAGPTGVLAIPIPRTWRIKITHSAGTSFTYAVGYSYVL
jgi:hypothetical protein